jgi:opacity protein-like surface antigen
MTRTDFSIGVLNLGGGVKAFIRDDIAIRIEYRYQKFSGQGESTMGEGFLYTNKVDFRIHTVQFGLSVLL